MIIVTGTMRSGTSMWMQVLVAAGLPYIGERFPQAWSDHFRAANPDGFFESQLVAGVYHATNPHPETGTFLFPDATARHAVKVFIPGIVRTDLAFVDRVIATVRNWREYSTSVERMRGLLAGPESRAPRMPPPLRWWVENFALIRDIATRRYAAHVTTYDRLLENPGSEVAQVVDWLGFGDAAAGAAVVDASARTQFDTSTETPELEARHLDVFDELYDTLHRGRDLDDAFVGKLNETDLALRPQIADYQARVREHAAQRLNTESPT